MNCINECRFKPETRFKLTNKIKIQKSHFTRVFTKIFSYNFLPDIVRTSNLLKQHAAKGEDSTLLESLPIFSAKQAVGRGCR